MTVDLAVVVVTYNSATFIDACLHAIPYACGGVSHEVIVVDNASRDGSAEHVRRHWPDVAVLDMPHNVGFSCANNRAIAQTGARAIVLLNGDAVPSPGSFATMLRAADDRPGVGVVAPRLLNTDGTDQGTARSFPTPMAAVFGRRSPLTRLFPGNRWSRRYMVGREHVGDEPFDVDWVSGACMLVGREVIDGVGVLDERFFMYWEDADWCRRIKAAGFRVLCVPDAAVVHSEGASSHGRPARQVRIFHTSAYRYYVKHHASGARRPLRPFVAVALTARGISTVGHDLIVTSARNLFRSRVDPQSARNALEASDHADPAVL